MKKAKKKLHPLDRVLAERFSGLLRNGQHEEDGLACALEAATVARKKKWSDDPESAVLPDLRPLNDATWSCDKARTDALVPAMRALWAWPKWSEKRRKALVDRVTLRLIREVLPEVFEAVKLPAEAKAMREAPDLAEAAGAARAAAGAARAAEAAAWAAMVAEAAGAARAAAGAARAAEAAAWAAMVAEDAGAARAAAGAAWAAMVAEAAWVAEAAA